MPRVDNNNFSTGTYDVACLAEGSRVRVSSIFTDAATSLGVRLYNPKGKVVGDFSFPQNTSRGIYDFTGLVDAGTFMLEYTPIQAGQPSDPIEKGLTVPYCAALARNTGFKAWQLLEQYDTATGQPTGQTKQNTIGDPDFVAPVQDTTFCPVIP